MNANLIGYKCVSFTDDSGKEVTGLSLFISYKNIGVEGLECRKIFIPGSRVSDVMNLDYTKSVGKPVEISLDFNGKPIAVTVV